MDEKVLKRKKKRKEAITKKRSAKCWMEMNQSNWLISELEVERNEIQFSPNHF